MVGRRSGEARIRVGGEGSDKRGEISYTLRFMYCFDSLRQPMLLQECQDHQTTVEAQNQSHDINNTGENVLLF